MLFFHPQAEIIHSTQVNTKIMLAGFMFIHLNDSNVIDNIHASIKPKEYTWYCDNNTKSCRFGLMRIVVLKCNKYNPNLQLWGFESLINPLPHELLSWFCSSIDSTFQQITNFTLNCIIIQSKLVDYFDIRRSKQEMYKQTESFVSLLLFLFQPYDAWNIAYSFDYHIFIYSFNLVFACWETAK